MEYRTWVWETDSVSIKIESRSFIQPKIIIVCDRTPPKIHQDKGVTRKRVTLRDSLGFTSEPELSKLAMKPLLFMPEDLNALQYEELRLLALS